MIGAAALRRWNPGRALLAAGLVALSTPAWASDTTDPTPVAATEATAPAPSDEATAPTDDTVPIATADAASEEPPAVPDDEARGLRRSGVDARDVALFVPRVALTPVKLALAGTFAPVRWGIRTFSTGSANLPIPFYFDRGRHLGVSPIVTIQPGLRPLFGAKLFYDDFGNGERLEISGAFGGKNLFHAGVQFGADRLGGSIFYARAGAKIEQFDTLLFSGIGSRDSVGARFSQRRLLGLLGAGVSLGDQERLQLGFTAIGNHRTFREPTRAPTTSVLRYYDPRKDLVGFEEGANTFELNALVRFWGPRIEGIRQTGPRLEVFGGPVWSSLGGVFAHAGLEAAWTVDLYGGNRLLTLRGFAETVEGPDHIIPFTALPRLGGMDRVRGYRIGRFRDKRAVGAGIEYRYPVHAWLQSVLFFDIGTVGHDWNTLVREQWHPGGGIGFLIGSSDTVMFRTDLAYGDGLTLSIATDVPLAFAGREEEL